MPLDSAFYIERSTDEDFHRALEHRDSIVLVEGARQMGKTSLVSRGLQRARMNGAKVTCTDFQKLNSSDLTSLESFFMTLGTALATQLDLEKFPEEVWRAKSGPNQNFESYLRREVLNKLGRPLSGRWTKWIGYSPAHSAAKSSGFSVHGIMPVLSIPRALGAT